MAARNEPHIISNATIVTVSQRGPPEITTTDVEVDAFTSGGRRILYVDCTSVERAPVFSGVAMPAGTSSGVANVVKDDPDTMTASQLAFYQQVKERATTIKDEEGEMNLMDVDEKPRLDDVARMTKKFKRIGDTPGAHPGDDDDLGHPSPAPDSPDGILVAYIKQIVHQDLQRPPSERFDTVRIKSPERHHWLALDGLSPKHLTLITCNEDIGELASLDRLEHRWMELETLRLEDVSDILWNKDDWATTVSTVKAITLSYCSALRLNVEGGFPNLTKLRIIENDAMATFARAGQDITGFSKRLEVLHLQSTNGCDARTKSDLMRFRDRLKKCTHLKDLTLILARADQDTGLPPYLPNSVENLSFHCSCSLVMLDDLEDWLKKPADRKWLPNLKSFIFKCDARTFDHLAIQSGESRTTQIRDVSLPPVAVKPEDAEADDGPVEGDSMDAADLTAREVVHGADIEEDDDDDDDYQDEGNETDDEDIDEDDEDEDMIKEEDDEDAQLNIGAKDDHNPILLPHITSMIASVLHKMKTRNPELEIIA
ncbi:hypothetical protein CVT26_011599 [Gymnopilus dilepis]|uniref:Uncharacterized protein n=1 Tax=Gymnopilus dilepis TaxID=231916 RepID=A0A409YQR1_9AGAR|nr:hypothetical protein CVT26_011599 [Gymnopilus dilepis]